MRTFTIFSVVAAFCTIAATAAPTAERNLESREPKELVKNLGFNFACVEGEAPFKECEMDCPAGQYCVIQFGA
jgi:hypothetical protein